jgi:uncharacterized membrane protein YdjX (TVP38/TMEM64 family)
VPSDTIQHGTRLRRYWLFPAVVLAVTLMLFLSIEAVGPSVLTDPSPWLRHPGPLAALVGFGLLVVDAALPVPSSLVMVANGALFGIAAGSLLSLAGALGAFLVGFAVGRRGAVVLTRFLPADELAGADRMLARWGLLAIVATRPVPLLAETVAVVAGASTLRTSHAVGAAVAGWLPVVVLYATAGAVTRTLEHATLAFASVVVVAGAFWLLGRQRKRQ